MVNKQLQTWGLGQDLFRGLLESCREDKSTRFMKTEHLLKTEAQTIYHASSAYVQLPAGRWSIAELDKGGYIQFRGFFKTNRILKSLFTSS
jgi:hypothetical protein